MPPCPGARTLEQCTFSGSGSLSGWPPPLAWHDIDIDNPRKQPRIAPGQGFREADHPLESQVLQALMGIIPAAELLDEEKAAVLGILHRAGWSDRRIWVRSRIPVPRPRPTAMPISDRRSKEFAGP